MTTESLNALTITEYECDEENMIDTITHQHEAAEMASDVAAFDEAKRKLATGEDEIVPLREPSDALNLISAVHAMIGYCESLEPGTVITEGYAKRMKEHYVANLEKAMAEVMKPRTQQGHYDSQGYCDNPARGY